MIDVKEHYDKTVKPSLKKQFDYKNELQIPRIEKVVLNMGIGETTSSAKAIEGGVSDITTIGGQNR